MTDTPRDIPSAMNVAGLPVARVGYGEVGGIFGAALAACGAAVRAFDVAHDDAVHGPAMRERAKADGVRLAADMQEALAGARLVVSAVTASETRRAARVAARVLPRPARFAVDG